MKSIGADRVKIFSKSRPARGAWIEIRLIYSAIMPPSVAPRKGRVD